MRMLCLGFAVNDSRSAGTAAIIGTTGLPAACTAIFIGRSDISAGSAGLFISNACGSRASYSRIRPSAYSTRTRTLATASGSSSS
jgi:hypothetical protein